ncbi:hypothetical protein HanRHA438_Chr16g0754251 [Helianthus annuus]|nr:hypothetical protein HanIR_Chr16g0807001 [Helianthus annuus]KAJ0835355.1 hypothetical protein HanRHA438_Chr16g0754251 [Helianthus annuus]
MIRDTHNLPPSCFLSKSTAKPTKSVHQQPLFPSLSIHVPAEPASLTAEAGNQ